MRSDNDRPLAVDVPRAADDRPQWIKVGLIAAVGFIVGIAWPRLVGVRLGPSAPGDAQPVAAGSAAPRPSEATSNGPAPVAPPAVVAAASAAAAVPTVPSGAPSAATSAAASSGPPKITVPRGVVVACKTEQGEALKGSKDCGALPAFDAIAQPRIRRIRDCSAAEGATGKLAVTLGVDFAGNRVDVAIGRGSNLPNLESIGACVKQQFAGISLGAVEHEHPRYTVSYSATLAPPDATPAGSAAAGTASAATSAGSSAGSSSVSGDAPTASVMWEVAIVRDAPRTGQVVSRLQRGTKVRVGQGQDNWYRVRYGSGFSSEGWVYRGAIGK